ncbi:hypothetical protein ACU5AX_09245 [Sphingomonas sp. XXL09]|uniref:hypothetical protein n=1 Tax=Sphingomonas sp. XXL09 TaxID=3457787 RepID=UPI00406BB978
MFSTGQTFHHRDSAPPALTARYHAMHCSCERCAPAVPADQLSLSMMGHLALCAAAVVTAIMFLIDPAGAADALRAVLP